VIRIGWLLLALGSGLLTVLTGIAVITDVINLRLDASNRRRLRPFQDADSLTRREREIVKLAVSGTSTRAIADRWGIAGGTLEAHLRHIYQKVGVRPRQRWGRRSLFLALGLWIALIATAVIFYISVRAAH
jgi:DNA-binding CsgD family transcriptional regulator